MSTTRTATRKRELAFLTFGATVFTLGIATFSVVCAVCAHPATVAAIG